MVARLDYILDDLMVCAQHLSELRAQLAQARDHQEFEDGSAARISELERRLAEAIRIQQNSIQLVQEMQRDLVGPITFAEKLACYKMAKTAQNETVLRLREHDMSGSLPQFVCVHCAHNLQMLATVTRSEAGLTCLNCGRVVAADKYL